VPTPRMQEQFSCCCGEDASSAELYEHLHDPLECLATVRLAGAVYTRRTSEIDKTDSRETIKRSMRKRKNDAQTITWRNFPGAAVLMFHDEAHSKAAKSTSANKNHPPISSQTAMYQILRIL
jgi:hypothetical protein